MKILVLGGGSDQAAFILELQSRGHDVILLDYLENPPAKKVVRKHIQESTLDIEAVLNAAETEKVDLICTACTDQALLTVAKVSEILHLPSYISYKTALDVTNKSYMKSKMEEYGIPTAKHRIIRSKTDIDSLNGLTFPLVVKPSDCNSSKGVTKVDNPEELKKYAVNALKLSRSNIAIVEEFKSGKEVSVDLYFEGENPKLLSATTSFKIQGTNGFTILGSDYPVINDSEENQLIKIAKLIGKAFKLKDTPLILQTILNNGEFSVIEFSARMGGGSKYKLIETISGVNILSKYVDLILGEKPSVSPQRMVNYARMKYVYCHNGQINDIQGLEYLKATKVIDEFFIYKSQGDLIEKHSTSSDRPLGYLITAENEAELENKDLRADQIIKVLNSQGQDIMIHNLNGR